MKKTIFVFALLALILARSTPAVSAGRTELVDESFEESVPPAGWRVLHLGQANAWTQYGYNAYSGDNSAICRSGPVGQSEDEWLVTPVLDTAGLASLVLEFYETGWGWQYHGHAHEILISTTVGDDPAAFTPFWQVMPSNYNVSWLNSSGSEWGHVQLDLAEFIGETIYVAIRYSGSYADNWVIDDIHIYEPSPHDVKGVALVPDGQSFAAGNEVVSHFTVKNVGENIETFTVELTVAHDGVPFYDETMPVTGLAAGDQTTVAFPAFTCAVGDYELTATAVLAEDVDPGNNTLVAHDDCFSGHRTPLGILYTNWDCIPCVQANQALDDWFPAQGNDASLIRVHVSWPGYYDPIYQANKEQSDFLLFMCPEPVYGVPTLYMDNTLDVADYSVENIWEDDLRFGYSWSADTGSPLEMAMAFALVDTTTHVTVTVLDPVPEGDYAVYVAVTEDDVYAPGVNGEEYHNQAFRRLFPGQEGAALDTALGVHETQVSLALDPAWVFGNLRATAWVQEVPGGKILGSATLVLADAITAVDDDPDDGMPPAVTALSGAYPNPFNPQTTIRFSLDRRQQVELSVFDIAGKRVVRLVDGVLEAGEHPVAWDGRDASGREVSSGTYLVRLKAAGRVHQGKLVLVR